MQPHQRLVDARAAALVVARRKQGVVQLASKVLDAPVRRPSALLLRLLLLAAIGPRAA